MVETAAPSTNTEKGLSKLQEILNSIGDTTGGNKKNMLKVDAAPGSNLEKILIDIKKVMDLQAGYLSKIVDYQNEQKQKERLASASGASPEKLQPGGDTKQPSMISSALGNSWDFLKSWGSNLFKLLGIPVIAELFGKLTPLVLGAITLAWKAMKLTFKIGRFGIGKLMYSNGKWTVEDMKTTEIEMPDDTKTRGGGPGRSPTGPASEESKANAAARAELEAKSKLAAEAEAKANRLKIEADRLQIESQRETLYSKSGKPLAGAAETSARRAAEARAKIAAAEAAEASRIAEAAGNEAKALTEALKDTSKVSKMPKISVGGAANIALLLLQLGLSAKEAVDDPRYKNKITGTLSKFALSLGPGFVDSVLNVLTARGAYIDQSEMTEKQKRELAFGLSMAPGGMGGMALSFANNASKPFDFSGMIEDYFFANPLGLKPGEVAPYSGAQIDPNRLRLNRSGAPSVIMVPTPGRADRDQQGSVTTVTNIYQTKDPAASLASQMPGGGISDIPIFNWGY